LVEGLVRVGAAQRREVGAGRVGKRNDNHKEDRQQDGYPRPAARRVFEPTIQDLNPSRKPLLSALLGQVEG